MSDGITSARREEKENIRLAVEWFREILKGKKDDKPLTPAIRAGLVSIAEAIIERLTFP